MSSTVYKYSLIKGSRKQTCPHCGRSKCFKPYINNETGENAANGKSAWLRGALSKSVRFSRFSKLE